MDQEATTREHAHKLITERIDLPEFWKKGFGQTLIWRERRLQYRMQRGRIAGTYCGGSQRLGIRLSTDARETVVRISFNGRAATAERDGNFAFLTLPAASTQQVCRFEIILSGPESKPAEENNK